MLQDNNIKLSENVRNNLLSKTKFKDVIFGESTSCYNKKEPCVIIKLSNNFVGLTRSEIIEIVEVMGNMRIIEDNI